MAEGRKNHLSQGGRGNGTQEREQDPHKVNYSTVCSRLGQLFPEDDSQIMN